jgi:hypothetical protein
LKIKGAKFPTVGELRVRNGREFRVMCPRIEGDRCLRIESAKCPRIEGEKYPRIEGDKGSRHYCANRVS